MRSGVGWWGGMRVGWCLGGGGGGLGSTASGSASGSDPPWRSLKFPPVVILVASLAILAVLFVAGQGYGTAAIAAASSPICLLWLVCLIGVGAFHFVTSGTRILGALSPHHILKVWRQDSALAWRTMGTLALCLTGTEAMFADLGHVASRPAIQVAATALVLPSLVVAYLGQGALLLQRPEVYRNVFWLSVPRAVFWPVWAVGLLAAVVASQALISACYQVVSQAIAQGLFPRFRVRHTSRKHAGYAWGAVGLSGWSAKWAPGPIAHPNPIPSL